MYCCIKYKWLDEWRVDPTIDKQNCWEVCIQQETAGMAFLWAYMTKDVKIRLKETNTESVIVTGGCTKYTQAPDLV